MRDRSVLTCVAGLALLFAAGRVHAACGPVQDLPVFAVKSLEVDLPARPTTLTPFLAEQYRRDLEFFREFVVESYRISIEAHYTELNSLETKINIAISAGACSLPEWDSFSQRISAERARRNEYMSEYDRGLELYRREQSHYQLVVAELRRPADG